MAVVMKVSGLHYAVNYNDLWAVYSIQHGPGLLSLVIVWTHARESRTEEVLLMMVIESTFAGESILNVPRETSSFHMSGYLVVV